MAVVNINPGSATITRTVTSYDDNGFDFWSWRLASCDTSVFDTYTTITSLSGNLGAYVGTYTFSETVNFYATQYKYYALLVFDGTNWNISGDVLLANVGDAPVRPALATPSNAVGNQALTVVLYWTNAKDASVDSVTCEIGESLDSLVSIITKDTDRPTDSGSIYLKPSTTYYWRVTYHNAGGDSYSDTRWFTTKSLNTSIITNVAYKTGTSVLTWTKPDVDTNSVTGYDVYLGIDLTTVTEADKTSACYKGRVTTTSYTVQNPTPDTLYFYRIDTYLTVPGYAIEDLTQKGVVGHFYTSSITLAPFVATTNVERLIAVIDNKVYYENADGLDYTAIAADVLTLSATANVDTLCAFNKCFIVNGAIKKVIDFTNRKIVLTELPKIPPRDTILYQGTSSVARATIDYIDLANLTVYAQMVNGNMLESADIYWMDETGAKQTWLANTITSVSAAGAVNTYDWKAYPETVAGSGENGEMPEDVDIVELYQGQVVLASSKNNIFYMSAPNNPFKFAYYDEAGGFASALGYTGKLGQNITAVIPFSDDYLILGTATQTWMFRGSPSSGATLDSVSNSIGVFNNECWTMDGAGTLYFMNANGIYSFTGNSLNSLTADVFPRFNSEFTVAAGYYLSMAYDKYNNGIMISSTGTSDHKTLFFSLYTGGFFEMTFGDIGGITSAIFDETKLIVGCKDGAIKYFDTDAKDDFSEYRYHVIDSAVQFGVFRLTNDELFTSLLESIEIYCGKESDLVLKIFNGLTADAVIDKIIADTPAFTGTITQIRSKTFNVRLRGSYFSIAIENKLINSSWAMERIAIKGKQFGKVRLI